MKSFKILILFMMLGLTSISCEDIFEDDISDKDVFPISPSMNEEIKGNTVNFRWEPVEGADYYRLQILKGSTNSRYVLDSLIEYTYYPTILDVGEYSWRLRAENGAYVTEFTDSMDFSVLFSEDLTDQSVVLNTPSDNIFTNSTEVYFTWKELQAAETYNFLLQRFDGQNRITVDQQAGLEEPYYKPESDVFFQDGIYIWSVSASNSISNTEYSSFNIKFDREIPGRASLVSPEDNKIFNVKSVSFQWNLPVDSGIVKSNRFSVLEIAKDVDFNDILEIVETESVTKNISFSESGTYYWRVKITDAAGNIGSYSNQRALIIN